MNAQLIEDIEAIPGEDGFYKSNCEETFKRIAQQLIDRGFTAAEAVELLSSVYSAVSDEYGN